MGKRSRGGDGAGDGDGDEHQELKPEFLPSQIKNKVRRSAAHAEVQKKKKLAKKKEVQQRNAREKEAVELGEEPPPRKIPRTIENTREADETLARPDDDELNAESAADEFTHHFSREKTPKILITTSETNSTPTRKFIMELLTVIPNAHYYKRGSYHLKQIVKYATNRDFTSMIVINENRGEPNGMLVVILPEGPTAHFKMSNVVPSKQIKGHGKATRHMPELILNNFSTRLGHRVGRMFASLFPQDPNFRGRRAVTFHNQRDFIFFRHHRYIFETKEIKEKKEKPTEKGKKSRRTMTEKAKPQTKEAVIARLQSSESPYIRGLHPGINSILKSFPDEFAQNLFFPSSGNYCDSNAEYEPEEVGLSLVEKLRAHFNNPCFKPKNPEKPIIRDSNLFKILNLKWPMSTGQKLVWQRFKECGPRFTLKLQSLQHGTFDSKFGEYEWVQKADMNTSRRRFFL